MSKNKNRPNGSFNGGGIAQKLLAEEETVYASDSQIYQEGAAEAERVGGDGTDTDQLERELQLGIDAAEVESVITLDMLRESQLELEQGDEPVELSAREIESATVNPPYNPNDPRVVEAEEEEERLLAGLEQTQTKLPDVQVPLSTPPASVANGPINLNGQNSTQPQSSPRLDGVLMVWTVRTDIRKAYDGRGKSGTLYEVRLNRGADKYTLLINGHLIMPDPNLPKDFGTGSINEVCNGKGERGWHFLKNVQGFAETVEDKNLYPQYPFATPTQSDQPLVGEGQDSNTEVVSTHG